MQRMKEQDFDELNTKVTAIIARNTTVGQTFVLTDEECRMLKLWQQVLSNEKPEQESK